MGKRLRWVPLMAVLPLLGGCTAIGFCCGRLTDFDETTDADRRKVERERRNEEEEKLEKRAETFEERARAKREKDYGAYLEWLVRELGLVEAWSKERDRLSRLRVIANDGLAGRDGLLVSARVERSPDYPALVRRVAKERFGEEISDREVQRVGLELAYAEPWVSRWFDSAAPGVDVTFSAGERRLGLARTDANGRAVLSLAPRDVPPDLADGIHPLRAEIARASGDRHAEDARLFVRRSRPERAVVVTADALFDLDPRTALRAALEDSRFFVRDVCTAPAVETLGPRVVVLSREPDALTPLYRRASAALLSQGGKPLEPLVVAAPTRERAGSDFLAEALAAQKGFWSEVVFVGADPAVEEDAAKRAGVPYHPVARPKDGGWCAGVGPIVPPAP